MARRAKRSPLPAALACGHLDVVATCEEQQLLRDARTALYRQRPS